MSTIGFNPHSCCGDAFNRIGSIASQSWNKIADAFSAMQDRISPYVANMANFFRSNPTISFTAVVVVGALAVMAVVAKLGCFASTSETEVPETEVPSDSQTPSTNQ